MTMTTNTTTTITNTTDTTATPSALWVRVMPLSDLHEDEGRVARPLVGGKTKQIAVFLMAGGEVCAVDNHCPHEGYPLAQGGVQGAVLTCRWHNFKFDLRTGQCLMGDEAVRRYPARVSDDGVVELDLTEPDPSTQWPARLQSMRDALLDRRVGQAVRDAVRLLASGCPPHDLALEVAALDATHGRYGPSHALALSWATLRLLPDFPGAQAIWPLSIALEVAAETQVREPARARPAPIDPGDDPVAAGERLCALVEAEAADAEALLLGALARGWGRAEVEPWLDRVSTAHLLDIGHATIYQALAFDLLTDASTPQREAILSGHLYGVITGTREDALPTWAKFRERVAVVAPHYPRWFSAPTSPLAPALALTHRAPLLRALVEGRSPELFDALTAALDAGVAPSDAALIVALAACERLLRFDASLDGATTAQHGWLDVTHSLTAAIAVCEILRRRTHPDCINGLFLVAEYTRRAMALDAPHHRAQPLGGVARDLLTALPMTQPAPQAAIDATLAAIRRRDPLDALSSLTTALHACADLAPLRHALIDHSLQRAATRPIFVAHALKTTLTAFDLFDALSPDDPLRALPLFALTRLLASPWAERPTPRLVHEALGLVLRGETPKRLF
jgi:nitrite reductase/ring-hydroxylating ferredoxin subunit